MKIPLKQYSKDVGQQKVATELGVTQGAICRAIQTNRNIFIQKTPDGKVYAFEIKPFPSQNKIGSCEITYSEGWDFTRA